MKAKDIRIGAVYSCRVSGAMVEVQIIAQRGSYWLAKNLSTGRVITLKSGRRLQVHISG